MSTLGERLKQAREAAGFETAALAAERVGVPYHTYAQHENGTRGFRADKANLYARAFGVSPVWLLFGKGEAGVSEPGGLCRPRRQGQAERSGGNHQSHNGFLRV